MRDVLIWAASGLPADSQTHALRALDVDSLTPLEALTLLNRWKQEVEH